MILSALSNAFGPSGCEGEAPRAGRLAPQRDPELLPKPDHAARPEVFRGGVAGGRAGLVKPGPAKLPPV